MSGRRTNSSSPEFYGEELWSNVKFMQVGKSAKIKIQTLRCIVLALLHRHSEKQEEEDICFELGNSKQMPLRYLVLNCGML